MTQRDRKHGHGPFWIFSRDASVIPWVLHNFLLRSFNCTPILLLLLLMNIPAVRINFNKKIPYRNLFSVDGRR